MKLPPTVNIKSVGLADAYHKLIKACLNEGAEKKRFYGKPVKTLDIVSLTEISRPLIEPMLHPDFPTKELHLAEYVKQWDREYDWKKQGFEYNYMDRLIKYPLVWVNQMQESTNKELNNYYHKSTPKDMNELNPDCVGSLFIDQLKVIREKISSRIEKEGECLVSNRDQVITWIPDRDMFVNEDQPCMQRIQFFVHSYPIYEYANGCRVKCVSKGKVEFHVSWRSRDLYSAWNSNMVGLVTMLNKEVFEPNNLDLVRVVDFCNSLHIYESDIESAKKVKPVSINPMYMR